MPNKDGDFKFHYMPKSDIALLDIEKDCPLVKLIGNEPCKLIMEKSKVVRITARGMSLTKINEKEDSYLFMVEPDLGLQRMRI